MLEKTFGLLFFLKKPKNYQTGNVPLYLRITVDGIQKEFSLKRNWDPSKWDNRANRAIGSKDDVKALNHYIDVMRNKVYDTRMKMIERGENLTAVALRDLVTGRKQRCWFLLKLFKEHNLELREIVGNGVAKGTIINFEVTYKHVAIFIHQKYQLEDINILSLDLKFVKSLYHWLRSFKACSHNTTIKNIANLKKIVLSCVDNGWLVSDPFAKFEMGRKPVYPEFLTNEELNKMCEKHITISRLEKVRDIFLFSCFTGLSFIDVKQLRASEITPGVDGKLWIVKQRQKSLTRVTVPILPAAQDILNKYADDPQCIGNESLLPVPSNQKYNAYLKEVADICNIEKKLTTHVARHTFATTVTLSNCIPIETVSKMLGHTNLRQTQHYAKVLPIKISQDMKQLYEKFQHSNSIIDDLK